jgi:xanthine dehydrogenase YagS FAD-binding subunit
MHPFSYVRATDERSALEALRQGPGIDPIAGGTDMMQLLKDDVRRPRRLVDINGLPWAQIEAGPAGLVIGALARMSDVAEHRTVRDQYPVIAEALLMSASPQVRNLASMGGNLMQRTRCVYFRDAAMKCNRREPGSGCSALHGENRQHAILGGSPDCVATHPSDLAVALVALDAVLRIAGPAGERRVKVAEFHLLPGATPERETALGQGELITAIEVPAGPWTRRSTYLKARDRASFEFAACSAAVALERDGDRVRSARIAVGGVATKPWRLPQVEAALAGTPLNSETIQRAAALATEGAQPLEHNGFKVPLLQRTVGRAIAATGELA